MCNVSFEASAGGELLAKCAVAFDKQCSLGDYEYDNSESTGALFFERAR